MSIFSHLGIGYSDENALQKKYVNEFSKFIEVDGLQVHYRKEGQGEPVVLIHGVLASLHTWDDWVAELKNTYTVYRIDMPGFGMSYLPKGRDFYNVDVAIPFVDKVLLALGLNKVHVVGNSLGGYITWHYAVAYSQKVNSLTVIDPVCYNQKLPYILNIRAHPLINPFVRFMAPKFIFSQSLKQVYGRQARLPAHLAQRYFDLTMRKGNKQSMAYIFKVFRKDSKNKALGDKIKNITVPTLVMWGKRDRWVSPKFVARWKNDVPHAHIIEYEDAGHIPMEEIPQETLKDFMFFLKQQVVT